ncbi:hypothetical protein MRB53_017086 [Persea americana]|uniref:Uncharacterized protein n=1 Tax=Persea americana TaxID=3435 RepID=A0ACC2M3Q0_PERAE|nr:hypothetical protein MRB53_017086 [Persea americana]
MIRSSIEKGLPAKKEGDFNAGRNPQEPSSSRPWSVLKDARIVRVSRTFGGKDRHSKVRTIRGLRDRRVRLSVPTAIQLYDLQDRLGLNQPSKVVDWLLNAAQHAIDELPPLQMPQENYVQYSQPTVVSREVTKPEAPITSLLCANSEHLKSSGAHSFTLLSGRGDVKSRNEMLGSDQTVLPKSMFWNSSDPLGDKCKGVAIEKSGWMKRKEHDNQESMDVPSAQKWTRNSLLRPSHSFLTGSLTNVTPYASCYHFGQPSNASVSHLGHGCSSQTEELHSLPSSLAVPTGPQLLLYPSGATPSLIPSYITPSIDFDPKQITNFQMLGPTSQNLQPNSFTASLYSTNPATRTFQLSLNPNHHHSHNSHETQSNALEKSTYGSSSATPTSLFLNHSKAALGFNSSSFM